MWKPDPEGHAPERMSRRGMLQGMLGAAALAAVGELPRTSLHAAQETGSRRIVFPWLTDDDPASLASLQSHAGAITHLSPTWFSMGADLSIAGSADPLVVTFARRRGISLHPLIHNGGYDPGVARRILETPQRRATAAERIAALVLKHGFDGINMDFEGTFGTSRDQYSDLLERLVAHLKPAGKWVTVDVVPQLKPASSYPASSWAAPYDFRRLGAACDAVMLMAYEYSVQRPGPISPLWWVRQVIQYARTQIQPGKLVLGFPFYGKHWSIAGGRTSVSSVTQVQALELLAWSGAPLQRPARDATPRFSWWDAGVQHVVHFDDTRSLAAKLQLLDTRIGGAAFWRLGKEDAGQWNVIGDWMNHRLAP